MRQMVDDRPSLDADEDGVAEAALDLGRPAKSALRSPLAEALAAILDAVSRTGAIRAVVLRLGGEPTLPAPEHGQTRARTEAQCRSEQAAVERLRASTIPFAAWLRGPVRGPVLEIALACGARVASEGYVDLAFSDLEIGLAPRLGGLRRALELAGLPAVLPLATLGKVIGPREAVELGLVDDPAPTRHGGAAVSGSASPRAIVLRSRARARRSRRPTTCTTRPRFARSTSSRCSCAIRRPQRISRWRASPS